MQITSLSFLLLLLFNLIFSVSTSNASLGALSKSVLKTRKLPTLSSRNSNDLEDSESSFQSGSARSTNSAYQSVDFSDSAVAERLKFYVKRNDSTALFCELRGNRRAVNLVIFESVFNTVLGLPENNRSSAIVATISAFIHFNFDIRTSNAYQSSKRFVIDHLKEKNKFLVALHILEQDFRSLQYCFSNGLCNFYATESAFLMLDTKAQHSTIRSLYSIFGDNLKDFRFVFRIFKRTQDVELCKLLISFGFDYEIYRNYLLNCRITHNSAKWDLYSTLYGNKIVTEIIDSFSNVTPQAIGGNKSVLPFVACPVPGKNDSRWEIYAQAFGQEIVDQYRLNVQDV